MLRSCSDRNPPEVFGRTSHIRMSWSAWLWVNGTAGSSRKRSTDSRQFRSRNARFCRGRRFLLPRRLGRGVGNGSWASGLASASATTWV